MVDVLLTILVFLVILTTIVVIHEGGHALAARLCGVRVTEFFVGMPMGPTFTRTSKRTGIRYGATFALFGGYTRIAGMDHECDLRMERALTIVNRRGVVSVGELADEMGCGEPRAKRLLDELVDWGSIEPLVTSSGGMAHSVGDVYRTVARDHAGLTVRDRGHDFKVPGATPAGHICMADASPWEAHGFFESERARTYQGVGVPKRVFILSAGVIFNLIAAFVAGVLYLTLYGVPTIPDEVIYVQEISPAWQIGMEAGDELVSIDGVPATRYDEVWEALDSVEDTSSVDVVFRRGDEVYERTADLGEDGILGIRYGYKQQTMGLGEAGREIGSLIAQTGEAVGGLLVPGQAAEVIEGSAGMVGIASMTADIMHGGFWPLLMLWATLSLSLGWMNLLPLLPLDGGHIVIELVQVVIRRPVPTHVQNAIAAVGIALIVLLFVVVTTQDVTRLIAG